MDMSNYRPKYFITTALQQASVKLTWDETHPDRTTTLQRAFNDDKELNVDVRAYLASSSSGDENDETGKMSRNLISMSF